MLIRTAEIEPMVNFFVNVIGLERGFRPPFPFKGAWLYSEGKHLIHLALVDKNDQAQLTYLERNTSSTGTGIIDHFALIGANYMSLLDRLKDQNVHYIQREVPLTKERQVFVYGPEQIVIEMIFPQSL